MSAKSCTFVSARTARSHRQATRPEGESMRNGIASCAFVLTNYVRHPQKPTCQLLRSWGYATSQLGNIIKG